jgi:hypothetical protein
MTTNLSINSGFNILLQIRAKYGVDMSQNKCYNCGKAIFEQDLVLKDISDNNRNPFHTACWKSFHFLQIKKDLIQYATLADGLFMILSGGLAFAFHDLPSFAFFGSTIAIAVGIGWAWFRLQK